MKYKIKNKKNNTYYKSTPFKGQFHWKFDEAHIFENKWMANRKLREIVNIKKLTNDDLVIERVK